MLGPGGATPLPHSGNRRPIRFARPCFDTISCWIFAIRRYNNMHSCRCVGSLANRINIPASTTRQAFSPCNTLLGSPCLFRCAPLQFGPRRPADRRPAALVRAAHPPDLQGPLLPLPRWRRRSQGGTRPAAQATAAHRRRLRPRDRRPASMPRACCIRDSKAARCLRRTRSSRAEELASIAAWIDAAPPRFAPSPKPSTPASSITPEERSFWSFQPIPAEVPIPASSRPIASARRSTPSWSRGSASKNLPFSPDADKTHAALARLVRSDRSAAHRAKSSPHFLADNSTRRLRDAPSIACSTRPTTASAGAATGSTSPAMPTPTATPATDRRATLCLQVSRLRDPRLQRRQAARSFITEQLAGDELIDGDLTNLTPGRTSTSSPRPAFCGWRPTAPPRSASTTTRPATRSMADTLKIVSTSLLGLERRLRPVPRPSLRSDSAGRLLSPAGRVRAGLRLEELAHARAAAASRCGPMPSEPKPPKSTPRRARSSPGAPGEASRLHGRRRSKRAGQVRRRRSASRCARPTRPPADKRTRRAEEAARRRTPASTNLAPARSISTSPMAAEELKKIDAQIAEIAAKKPFQDFIPMLERSAGQLPHDVPVPSRRSSAAQGRDRSRRSDRLLAAGRAAGDRRRRSGAADLGPPTGAGPLAHRRQAIRSRPACW